MSEKPWVLVLSTGGTIATTRDARSGELAVTLPGTALGGWATDAGVAVRLEEVLRLPSTALGSEDALALCRAIARAAAGGPVGIVVTHGTATLEEVAFFVSLVVPGTPPVVFTGAMREADQPDADGPRNLREALRVAAAPASRGRGVLVVMDGVILSATAVVKQHANRVGAFGSRHGGAEGGVTEAGIVYLHGPRESPVRFPAARVERRVDLVRTCFDPDPGVIASALARGVRGLVLEAMGSDGIPPALQAPLEGALDEGVAVVVATRCPAGVSAPKYPVARALARRGAVFAGALDGLKARILLMLALGDAPERDDLQLLFDRLSGTVVEVQDLPIQKGAVSA